MFIICIDIKHKLDCSLHIFIISCYLSVLYFLCFGLFFLHVVFFPFFNHKQFRTAMQQKKYDY